MLNRERIGSLLVAIALWPAIARCQEEVLIDFGKDFDLSLVESHGTKLSLHGDLLRMETDNREEMPGIVFKPSEGRWNLRRFHELAIEVKNAGTQAATIQCMAKSPDSDGVKHCSKTILQLQPGEISVLRVTLTQAIPPEVRVCKLPNMRAIPLGLGVDIDPGNISELSVSVVKPRSDCILELGSPRLWILSEPTQAIDPDEVFPMIDKYGQYIHKEWPGKIHSDEDFATRVKQEEADLAAHPGPKEWNQYGGWLSGPQLNATGFFRTEKVDGKWWLVDPEGRLFWSWGNDGIASDTAVTAISKRESWFADLPPKKDPANPDKDSPFSAFWSTSGGDDKTPLCFIYNYTGSNLLRKYGSDWGTKDRRVTFQRFRSWGMNTINDNMTPDVVASLNLPKTPYLISVAVWCVKTLDARDGYWGPIYDVFSAEFPARTEATIGGIGTKLANDPWCIGFFIDNEMSWGNETAIGVAALRSPPEQPAKVAFLDDLRKKYETIDRLNAAWRTQHASWDALLQSTTAPDRKTAHDDLVAFTARFSNRYFEVHSTAVKKFSPHHLYLGCRFSRSNEPAVRAAAKYCDVVSFNRYQYTVADLRLPKGEDKPIIVSEFHFGALDRGMFHPTLSPTTDQDDRARKIKKFVESALRNPLIVGATWFQYREQSSTGLPDNEMYQLGFMDVCDTPYWETIQASREIGDEMYRLRAGR